MDNQDKISLFGGRGFILGNFARLYPDSYIEPRDNNIPKFDNIIYGISTVTNYNIFIDIYLDVNTNLIKLLQVLENCKNKNITFNFISSWFVFGNGGDWLNSPAKETDRCEPLGFYSISKRTSEQLLISYCNTFNIKYRILRLANVFGPGDKFNEKKNALQYLISKLVKNENFEWYSNGEPYRNFIYVEDACRAIRHVMDFGELNTIYNIGSFKDTQFKEAILYCKDKLNSTSQLTSIEPKVFHTVCQVRDFKMDTTKLQNLGFECKYSLEDGLDLTIETLKNR